MTLPSFGSFFNSNVGSEEPNSQNKSPKFPLQDGNSSPKFRSHFANEKTIQGKYYRHKLALQKSNEVDSLIADKNV